VKREMKIIIPNLSRLTTHDSRFTIIKNPIEKSMGFEDIKYV